MATVFVGNLSPDVTDTDLLELFAPFGKVTGLRLLSGRGTAYVDLNKPDASEQAVELLRGKQLKGRTMDVAVQGGGGGRPAKRSRRR